MKPNLKNVFPPPLSSFWAHLQSRFPYLLPYNGTGRQGKGIAVSSSHIVSAAPSSSNSSQAPAWSPSHGKDSSMNYTNMGPSHGLQFFMSCFRVGPFHRVQSFRNRLLQRGSPMGSQALSGNLLQHGLLSIRSHLLPGTCSGSGSS